MSTRISSISAKILGQTRIRITWFTTESAAPPSRQPNTNATHAQRRSTTPQQTTILYGILQVRELCPISLQRPQRLSTRTLFTGVSPSSRLPPSFSAIRSDTSPTVRVSSARTYRLLRVLRFVSVSTASRRRPISSYTNTIL
jgi:hypothetical protein